MPHTHSGPVIIDYDDVGNGDPTLLLLPGWCATRDTWNGVIGLLSERRRVLALDWRGHGRSGPAEGDFGERDLVTDALAVLEESGAQRVIPVAHAHAGWVAIELRRRLRELVPGLVFEDWLVTPAPADFLMSLESLRSSSEWREAVDGLIEGWAGGVDDRDLLAFLEAMRGVPEEMWDRAGREVEGAYALHGSPLEALAELDPPAPALHLYAQPRDPDYLIAQQAFGVDHPWFTVQRLEAASHFPAFEVPGHMAAAIEEFVQRLTSRATRRAA